MNKIQEAIENLEAAVRAHCNKNVVSFTIFVNCEGRIVTIDERGSSELKVCGISMRNLSGEFIGV